MPLSSRLSRQIRELVDGLAEAGIEFALIGGLALAGHRVVRATQDVDLLIDIEKAESAHRSLESLGYTCIHRSDNAGNYARRDERVDFLYASRPIARRLLANAAERRTSFGRLRVVSAEGLIGFKLQALANDPRRTQDLEDIRALMRANRPTLDMIEVRSFFELFEAEALLERILHEIAG
jgi:hypothetical protein